MTTCAQNKQKQEALARQQAYEREAEERTAKNRLKRQRKKAGRGANKAGDKAPSAGAADDAGGSGGGADKKRKLASGGSGFVFKKAEERDASVSDEEAESGQVGGSALAQGGEDGHSTARFGLAPPTAGAASEALAPEAGGGEQIEEVRAAQEAGIVIQDDD